jgi:hypothetical protein
VQFLRTRPLNGGDISARPGGREGPCLTSTPAPSSPMARLNSEGSGVTWVLQRVLALSSSWGLLTSISNSQAVGCWGANWVRKETSNHRPHTEAKSWGRAGWDLEALRAANLRLPGSSSLGL